jgi:phosphoglycerol transferase MdoB-like AlkP superfamily enzyme
MEESLGAEFVGSLGGKNLTPNLDRLSRDGIWLERLYATGTRSVRGIEAVLSGFPPTNRRSVVKLMETQDDFFTIASLLLEKGYLTGFLYGGEAHFDNMKRFFLNNGIQTVIDEKDFEDPEYFGTWGVSDEDLFNRAHDEFLSAGDQPFFSFLLTSSNHKPFDIPEGRVEPETGPDGPRETAVKYADYALGRFFEMASGSDYWDNTVFLVTADHNSRVYGDQLVPIERFHIPGLFIGGQIESRRVPGISSQIDLLPTLLSLAGISATYPRVGRDLTSPEYNQGAGRAIMQFYQIAAYLVPGRAVILQPDLPVASFRYRPGGELMPDPFPDPDLEQTALAWALFGSFMTAKGPFRH